MTKIELLSPARDLSTGLAAIECGADAVYIGGPAFGARAAAGNPVEDIAALARRAHTFGARVYATMNTLLFDSEIAAVRAVAQSLLDAEVDALIVQDMAFLRMGLLRPDGSPVEFHASTQTQNLTPERVRFLAGAGFRRVILERALSLNEIRDISNNLRSEWPSGKVREDFANERTEACVSEQNRSSNAASGPLSPQIEAFVHGAICVGMSGRCYLARAMGEGSDVSGVSRSGNRGTCSQPCRLPWDLQDGAGSVVVRGKHLLSVRDLDLSPHLDALLAAGVTSFKIEGRLKDEAYIRNIVTHYNSALNDAIVRTSGFVRASVGRSVPDFAPSPAKTFSRGTTSWFFDNPHPYPVATPDSPKAIGERLGTVEKVACDRTGGRWFTLAEGDATSERNEVSGLLSPQDGICFFAGGRLHGSSVNRVSGGRIYLADSRQVEPGTEIFRNHDHRFVRGLENSRMRRRIAVEARVEASAEQIAVTFVDPTGIAVRTMREGNFEPARDPEKMFSTFRDELARSGDTIFEVSCRFVGGRHDGSIFVPVSVVAALRREGLARLLAEREKLIPERRPALENPTEKFPSERADRTENVTNSLAERFYRDHGVTLFEPQSELADDLAASPVMTTKYCPRRELGMCRSGRDEGSKPENQTLFLVHGATRLRLDTNCKNCLTTLVKI